MFEFELYLASTCLSLYTLGIAHKESIYFWYDGENNFTQNKLVQESCKKSNFLHKISAKVQIWNHLQFNYMVRVDLIDIQIQN